MNGSISYTNGIVEISSPRKDKIFRSDGTEQMYSKAFYSLSSDSVKRKLTVNLLGFSTWCKVDWSMRITYKWKVQCGTKVMSGFVQLKNTEQYGYRGIRNGVASPAYKEWWPSKQFQSGGPIRAYNSGTNIGKAPYYDSVNINSSAYSTYLNDTISGTTSFVLDFDENGKIPNLQFSLEAASNVPVNDFNNKAKTQAYYSATDILSLANTPSINPLSIKITNLSLSGNSDKKMLNWSVSANEKFDKVEWSLDGKSYTTISLSQPVTSYKYDDFSVSAYGNHSISVSVRRYGTTNIWSGYSTASYNLVEPVKDPVTVKITNTSFTKDTISGTVTASENVTEWKWVATGIGGINNRTGSKTTSASKTFNYSQIVPENDKYEFSISARRDSKDKWASSAYTTYDLKKPSFININNRPFDISIIGNNEGTLKLKSDYAITWKFKPSSSYSYDYTGTANANTLVSTNVKIDTSKSNQKYTVEIARKDCPSIINVAEITLGLNVLSLNLSIDSGYPIANTVKLTGISSEELKSWTYIITDNKGKVVEISPTTVSVDKKTSTLTYSKLESGNVYYIKFRGVTTDGRSAESNTVSVSAKSGAYIFAEDPDTGDVTTKLSSIYIYHDGKWNLYEPYVYSDGSWKIGM